MKKQNSSKEKTRERLINSFWELYKKEDINKININDLCTNADYERTTFYRYFRDINDILNQVEDGIINNLHNSIMEKLDSKKSNEIIITNFRKFANKYGEYIVTFCEKGNTSFYLKFKKLIKDDVYQYMNINLKNDSQKEFLFEFVFASLLNSFTYWYNNQNKIKLESFVDFTNTIILNGTKSIMSFKKIA